ncbi:PucR family transcriptional regulator [Mycolicibacterium mengxianglii]|uniref:PucR family transcriptional regulator n=1 Tax=Mycolicibacterium mengxianglii TaxID=2736649 RepID=UPI001E4DDD01|nr:PucR family transcriptional regulator [Mycolicibacterium mengxianglii]
MTYERQNVRYPNLPDTPMTLVDPVDHSVIAAPHDGTVSLAELLAEATLHVDVLIEPVDTARAVRYVYPTELADPSPYLRGEELVLSVGVPIADQPDDVIEQYVTTLKSHRVTALLVGLGDLFTDPPEALLRACREQDLPLLAQRAAVPFRRIVDWVDGRRAADRTVDARERDLGSMLRWFVAGTLGAGPVEHELALRGLAGVPVAVCAFPADRHTDVHRLVDGFSGAVAVLEDRIIVLCAHTAEFSAALAQSELVCGVAIAPDSPSMAQAIPEALEALKEGLRHRRVVRIDEMATLEGLLAAVPKTRLVPFVHQLLVPLVDHDKMNNTHLMTSLQAFLSPDNDISTAAAQLYVHVNTLRNRLAKITELTGASPFDESERINFRIALWAARNMGMRDIAERP